MVSLTPDAVFDARRNALCCAVMESLPSAPIHTTAFAFRIFRISDLELLRAHANTALPILDGFVNGSTTELEKTAAYGGVPEIAALGFALARQQGVSDNTVLAFLNGIERLRSRPANALDVLATDDVALLGVADGLAALHDNERTKDAAAWLATIVGSRPASSEFSARLRTLTLELVEPRGRLRASVAVNDEHVAALEIVCQTVWPQRFEGSAVVSDDARRNLFISLMRRHDAQVGDLETAALELTALGRLLEDAVVRLLPTLDDLVRVLKDTQTSLKRWVWQSRARRGVDVARWLIDSEPHVQAFLWAVLYPIYRDSLRDEQYLLGFGLKQPRYDLAVLSLETIVEVKFARNPDDFEKIEEEIAGDLGIYFADPHRLRRMVVYVYDDSDDAAPERYALLRNALRARDDRIHDVVVVRRPSMIPNRSLRGSPSSKASA